MRVEVTSIERAIRESYLVRGFSEEALAAVANLAHSHHFDDGEAILQQYDRSRDLHILVEGRAQIVTIIGDSIGVIREGMPIGEVSFIDGKPRSVSVLSVGSSIVATFKHCELQALLDSDPHSERAFLRNISSVLCARLRSANNNITALLAIDESESKAPFESGLRPDFLS
jgi:CRP-like cAMP-binding protein